MLETRDCGNLAEPRGIRKFDECYIYEDEDKYRELSTLFVLIACCPMEFFAGCDLASPQLTTKYPSRCAHTLPQTESGPVAL
jgi:hypothetical protein